MPIRIDTTHVAEAGQRLSAASDRLSELGSELQAAIHSLDTWAWEGRSRARAEPLLARVRPESNRVAEGLDDLGRKLARVAAVFEQEDAAAAGNLAAMPWVDFEADGAVLGVATAAIPTILLASVPLADTGALDVDHMSWAERFAAANALPGQIQQLEQLRQEGQTELDRLNGDIDAIDWQIADLQAQRDALQQQADKFLNKVLPDGLQWGFDDRFPDAPWRTRSDTLEDQIAELDRQIAALQSQRAPLDQQRQNCQQQLSSLDRQLNSLRQSQAELDRVMGKGIPMDGPSPIYPYFPDGNCTKYAASRRNVPCRGHAYQWNEQAQAAGFEIGDRPVPGAVMVMERGVKGADATYGHVAIVERVERQSDGSYKIWYTDNHNTNPATSASRTIVPGAERISFIYDKR